ncbi:MAG: sulfatase-like hydrolase/transferase [Clostridia bacterium]|nr:sulfatase-like hydrolase/transferase [Clostridia bacterium]
MKDVENKKQNKFFEALWKWSKDNRYFLLFVLFTAIMEMTTVFFLDGNPFMTRPFLSWGLLAFLGGLILLIPSRRVQVIVFSTLLILQFALQIVFSVIFDLTEQYFEYEMLNLKNDAFGTLENIPIRFGLFFIGIILCIVYVIVGLRGTRERPKFKADKKSVFIKIGAAAVGVATIFTSFFCYYPRNINRYEQMIDGKTKSSYSAYGVTGNLLGEFIGAMFPDKSTITDEDIEKFIYDENAVWQGSKYFGVSQGNNVITILGETLEWFSFMVDETKYPNALKLTDEEMKMLFPTMTKFMGDSVKMTNFHSREKTDISETLSIMGSYPTTAYINYDYYDNAMPLTISNILKTMDSDVQCRSFHNGFKTFYNRDDVHRSFGFESLTDMYDMARMAQDDYNNGLTDKITFTNYMKRGERNLDSEMIEVCKDEMFPTDKRFYTYITTITMHGIYYDRDNLDVHDQRLRGVLGDRMPDPEDEDLKDDLLYHYMTAAMEFEVAITKMMDELATRPDNRTADPNDTLLDNTTIVIFGDHNAYYHSLSKYVKDIYDYDTEKRYTDLYNVPLMIYDEKLTAAVAKAENGGGADMTIDKFTCTADIASTILDLLGIHYYENLYYGTSVFSDKASVLYSRAYDTFIGSGIVGKSVNNLLYQHPNADVATYKATAIKLVEKIKYCDYIYKQNYFGNEENMQLYLQKMAEINA